jgi:hypothetical protein
LVDAVSEKRLEYSVLQSREPAKISPGFGLPYGYMMAKLLVALDYRIRLVRSAALRDRMSWTEGFRRIEAPVPVRCRQVHFGSPLGKR